MRSILRSKIGCNRRADFPDFAKVTTSVANREGRGSELRGRLRTGRHGAKPRTPSGRRRKQIALVVVLVIGSRRIRDRERGRGREKLRGRIRSDGIGCGFSQRLTARFSFGVRFARRNAARTRRRDACGTKPPGAGEIRAWERSVFHDGRKRGCGANGKVFYLACRFKVTLTVTGKSGGTLILRVGLARRTSAELPF